ncbi:E3 ubiquitin-protein ligase TRIM39-like [Protopterus annectens]|uniref:E3 ubiquitin-protein ligase TRIM39-like n=1 Tax=Protopterus annectens TaxID=7888 RepID=UPI001CF9957E|nr:E3 ubiquitin-protein ligase TRIM39-like [Protopterus annectens]
MKMAAASEELTNEAVCSICLDYFYEPVLTDCGHNFCRACITEFWNRSEGKVFCPNCRAEFEQKVLRPNRQLANLVNSIRKLSLVIRGKPAEEQLCKEHEEKLKLFCEDDLKPICVVCDRSLQHRYHRVLPVGEVVKRYKKQLEQSRDYLKKQMESILIAQAEGESKIYKINADTETERQKIISKFDQLQHSLNREKEKLLQNLDRDRTLNLETVNDHLAHLAQQTCTIFSAIEEINERLKLQEAAFLTDIKKTLDRCNIMIQIPAVEVNSLKKNEADQPMKYVSLWKQLLKFMRPEPAPLTLDPKTAHCNLYISQDLTVVNWGDVLQNCPNNSERFDYWPCVLSSQGFSSGRHYWEVSVGDSSGWYMGAARQSVERKGWTILTAENGCWTLGWSSGEYMAGIVRLPLREKLTRVGLYLDYEEGELSFYNVDNMSQIHTYKDSFTEKMFPFFRMWSSDSEIKICHSTS